jgi:hypothetical protein
MLTGRGFDLIAETQGTVTITPSTDMLMQFGTFPATGPALSLLFNLLPCLQFRTA